MKASELIEQVEKAHEEIYKNTVNPDAQVWVSIEISPNVFQLVLMDKEIYNLYFN